MDQLKARRVWAMAMLSLAALPGACTRPVAPGSAAPNSRKLPAAALDQQIGASIGDPTTCVLVLDAATGKTLYQYGADFNCRRPLPACDRPGTLTAHTAASFSAMAGGRQASCNLSADGSLMVGWAEGKVLGARPALVYSAVMDGDRALPGHEISARLDNVFYDLGI